MFTLAIDVGGPDKIGWASSDGGSGAGDTLGNALEALGNELTFQGRATIGFECPIWVPRRADLRRITSRRGGAEQVFNRAWSAGAGCGVLAAGLGLMPWCFSEIAGATDERRATTDRETFVASGGLFVWEAFVSGAAKATTHMDDASMALVEFAARGMDEPSDIPAEAAVNLAATALIATGWQVAASEIACAGHVIAVGHSRIDATQRGS